MKNISVFNLGWVVGIIEGEGTFSTNKTRSYTAPRFYLYSPDEWVEAGGQDPPDAPREGPPIRMGSIQTRRTTSVIRRDTAPP